MMSKTTLTAQPVTRLHRWITFSVILIALAACAPSGPAPAAPSSPQPKLEITVPKPTPTKRKILPQPAPEQSPLPAPGEPGPLESPLSTPFAASPTEGPSPTLEEAVPGRIGILGPNQLRDLAIADLAGRLSIRPDAITVRTLESVDWPDASLGCPNPDFMYAQVITPGYRIILEAGGRAYAYHASLRSVTLCEK